jgi:uncharacterized protein (TIGR02611 family)
MASQERPRSDLSQRLRARRADFMQRGRLYRIAFVTAGFTVLAAGLAMLLLPGPALVVIPIGLAMLSLQFAWAESLLEKALDKADVAKEKATETSPLQKVLSGIAIALGVGAFIALAILYDIPLLPV